MNDERPIDPSHKPRKKEDIEVRYVPVEYIQQEHEDTDAINILDLIKNVWSGRITILKIVAVFTVLALFNYLFGPTEYESDSILLQENQAQGSQTQQLLQRLGGSIGISATGVTDEIIPPTLYPQIIYSLEFQRELLFEEIEFERYGTLTLFEYFTEVYDPPLTEKTYSLINDLTLSLPITLYRWGRDGFRWIRNGFQTPEPVDLLVQGEEDPRFLILSREEQRQITNLRNRISIEMANSLITIRTSLPDPKASAEINHMIIGRIQEYVTNYRVEKAQQNLAFVELQQLEAKERYDDAQQELARFRDQNVTLTSAIARTQQEELQNRRDLRFNVYNSISQQVEQARLKVQEETPVFNILQRSSIPTRASSGSRLLLIATIFIGFVVGVTWIFLRDAFSVIRKHIES